jgi:hypothetical protein
MRGMWFEERRGEERRGEKETAVGGEWCDVM